MRLSKTVQTTDIDVAVNMLCRSIFNEEVDEDDENQGDVEAKQEKRVPKKRGRANKDEDEEFEEQARNEQAHETGVATRRQNGDVKMKNANKRMKADDEEEVGKLFQKAIQINNFDISVKKFIFKMIGEISNQIGSGQVSVTQIWQKYFNLQDSQQLNSHTGKQYLQTKDELIEALKQMEHDDIIMLEGNNVFITS